MTILDEIAIERLQLESQTDVDRYYLNRLANWVDAKEKSLKSEIDERVEAYRVTLVAASKAEFDELSKLRAEVNTLILAEQKRLDDAKVAEASQDPRIGKRYCQWKRVYTFRPFTLTGVVGVAQVLTSEMKRDLKQRGCYYTEVGHLVIRRLKKDGTPSMYYYAIKNYEWYPEGEDPNVKK